jgi:hypothetical protein
MALSYPPSLGLETIYIAPRYVMVLVGVGLTSSSSRGGSLSKKKCTFHSSRKLICPFWIHLRNHEAFREGDVLFAHARSVGENPYMLGGALLSASSKSRLALITC